MCAHNHIHADLNSCFVCLGAHMCASAYVCVHMCTRKERTALAWLFLKHPPPPFSFVVLVWLLLICLLFQTGSDYLALASLELHM